jgi:hypothetical protein
MWKPDLQALEGHSKGAQEHSKGAQEHSKGAQEHSKGAQEHSKGGQEHSKGAQEACSKTVLQAMLQMTHADTAASHCTAEGVGQEMDFFIAFLAVSLHEELKNTIKQKQLKATYIWQMATKC